MTAPKIHTARKPATKKPKIRGEAAPVITPELRAEIVEAKEDLLLDGHSFTATARTLAERYALGFAHVRRIMLDED